MRAGWFGFVGVLAVIGTAEAQTVVKREPGAGGMRRGEVLYVDDGRCPKGQIKMVTAGTFGGQQGGRGTGQSTGRTRTCVPRP